MRYLVEGWRVLLVFAWEFLVITYINTLCYLTVTKGIVICSIGLGMWTAIFVLFLTWTILETYDGQRTNTIKGE